MKKTLINNLKIFVVSLIISIPLILPYANRGYFPTHDGEWAVVRLSEMYREIKDLQIPPRYSEYLNFQYGYPLFNFDYPGPYYLGLPMVFLKLGFINAIKILFALSIIFSTYFMFLLSSYLWKNQLAGFISSFLYIYAPYRIVDLFVRGSLGESLSFVLFPLILYEIKRLYDTKSIKHIILNGILLAALVLTHNIMTVLFGFVILSVLIVAVIKKQIKFLRQILISIFLAIGISIYFWLPAIFEKSLISLSKIPIADRSLYFVKPLELIIPKWGYAPPTDPNGFSYQLGIPQILVIGLVIMLLVWKAKVKESFFAIFGIVLIAILSSLMFSWSNFIWKNIPLLSEINYPWTILAILVFLVSLVSGFMTRFDLRYKILGLILCAVSFLLIIPHAAPQIYFSREDSFYTTNQATTTSSNELMPLWVKDQPKNQPLETVQVLGNSTKIDTSKIRSNSISFSLSAKNNEIVQINKIFYPGWQASVNGENKNIEYNNKLGVMQLSLEKGENVVNLRFSETPLRLLSDLLSLVSIIFVTLFVAYKRIKFVTKNL